MRIIDSETHPVSPRGLEHCYPMDRTWRYPYIPAIVPGASEAIEAAVRQGEYELLSDALLEQMDTHGVALSVVMNSAYPILNEHLVRVVKEHPDRFVAFATFDGQRPAGSPPRETDASLAALEHGLRDLGMRGVGEANLRRYAPARPDEAYQGYAPVFELCRAYHCPILFHTGYDAGAGSLQYRNPINLEPLAAGFRDVPILVAHMGKHDTWFFEAALMLARKYPNVYLTTSNSRTDFLERAVSEVGAERIVWGSDWSLQHGVLGLRQGFDVHKINLDVVRQACIRDDEKELILGENLARLLAL